MRKSHILKLLKAYGLVKGKSHTVGADYLWDDLDEICGYSVCRYEKCGFDGIMETVPVPIENYDVDEIEKAVDKFIELESR